MQVQGAHFVRNQNNRNEKKKITQLHHLVHSSYSWVPSQWRSGDRLLNATQEIFSAPDQTKWFIFSQRRQTLAWGHRTRRHRHSRNGMCHGEGWLNTAPSPVSSPSTEVETFNGVFTAHIVRLQIFPSRVQSICCCVVRVNGKQWVLGFV